MGLFVQVELRKYGFWTLCVSKEGYLRNGYSSLKSNHWMVRRVIYFVEGYRSNALPALSTMVDELSFALAFPL